MCSGGRGECPPGAIAGPEPLCALRGFIWAPSLQRLCWFWGFILVRSDNREVFYIKFQVPFTLCLVFSWRRQRFKIYPFIFFEGEGNIMVKEKNLLPILYFN